MVYLIDNLHCGGIADVFNAIFPLMPIERQQKARRYRRQLDRDLSVLAYGLLLYGLRNEYDVPAPPAFTYGENGKPYLAEYPGIYFNLSHCNIGVACAISNMEVGVDIQDARSFNIDVARRVCTNKELDELSRSQNPQNDFCKLWTIKESYIKQYGGSISYPLWSLSANALAERSEDRFGCYWDKEYSLACFGEKNIQKVQLSSFIYNNGISSKILKELL